MSSVSSNFVRRPPQQERSERRLAHFLQVASQLMREVGYDATTMTEIAERSGTSIGGLYHYFPDKNSIAIALLNQYAAEVEGFWQPILARAKEVNHEQFADLVLEGVIQFLEERPAYLKLLAAQIQTSGNSAARRALRAAFANALQVKNPSLSEDRALLAANVVLEIIRGMKTRYTEASVREKAAVVAEFRKILAFYMGSVLSED
jgi:AcrR family transcriptional regulator